MHCREKYNIKPNMKTFTNSQVDCRRVILYKEYMANIDSIQPSNKCCDICSVQCNCQPKCDHMVPQLALDIEQSNNESEGDESSEDSGGSSSEDNVDTYRAAKPSAVLYGSDSD